MIYCTNMKNEKECNDCFWLNDCYICKHSLKEETCKYHRFLKDPKHKFDSEQMEELNAIQSVISHKHLSAEVIWSAMHYLIDAHFNQCSVTINDAINAGLQEWDL